MNNNYKKFIPQPILSLLRRCKLAVSSFRETCTEIISIPTTVAPRSYGSLIGAYLKQHSRDDLREIWLRNPLAKVVLRDGTSDFDVFRQVLLCKQYGANICFQPTTIIDAGANIGLSSLFFLRKFPQARIVAIEPDPENLEIAELNLRDYSDRCVLLHGAVWHETTSLNLSRGDYRDGRHWASQVTSATSASLADVPAFTIDDIQCEYKMESIDLLKMDIEGAELQVFRDGDTSFMNHTRCCMLEVHNDDCYQAMMAAINPYPFKLWLRSEVFVINRMSAPTPLKLDDNTTSSGDNSVDTNMRATSTV